MVLELQVKEIMAALLYKVVALLTLVVEAVVEAPRHRWSAPTWSVVVAVIVGFVPCGEASR